MYIGVIYRPPNGDRKGALHEIEALVKRLPTNNFAITGDLLSPNSGFQQIFYANNFIPLISIPTHETPGCRETLININRVTGEV